MSGYAVDMNGALVDGVVVEREKARVTFESEARQVVEKPSVSLAEHVVGNVFKTRVFPVPKNGTRTIKVTYVEELKTDYGNATYNLPLSFAYPIANYALSVVVDTVDTGIPVISTDMGQNIQMGMDLDEGGKKKRAKQVFL